MGTCFRELPDRDPFPLRLPDGLLEWTRRAEDESPFGEDYDAEPDFLFDRWWPGAGRTSVVFPPVGFVELSEWLGGDMGNGDYFGLYWPIGREDEVPLIARSSHDCQAVIPIASSLATASRLHSVAAPEGDRGGPCHQYPKEMAEVWKPDELSKRLEIDPDSPYLLVANADVALDSGDVPLAESLYLKATQALPEYTAAHIGLTELYRRAGRPRDECYWALEALRSPLSLRGASFWAFDHLPTERVNRENYRGRLLRHLRQMSPGDVMDLAEDPLFRSRGNLTGISGVVKNKDYSTYDILINEYIKIGRPIEAVKLAMHYGESMEQEHWPFFRRYGRSMETSARVEEFYQRHDYNEATQKARLLKALRAAGLDSRAELLAEVIGEDGSS